MNNDGMGSRVTPGGYGQDGDDYGVIQGPLCWGNSDEEDALDEPKMDEGDVLHMLAELQPSNEQAEIPPGQEAEWNALQLAVEDYSDDESDGKHMYPKPKYMSDDQILLDAAADTGNSQHVDTLRQDYLGKPKKDGKMPESDAVLSCPCCFTVLCFDCQQHSLYHTQYRAVFVRNCVTKPQVLRESSGDTVGRPVACEVCGSEVAVMDRDGVYHFFDVLPSK